MNNNFQNKLCSKKKIYIIKCVINDFLKILFFFLRYNHINFFI